MFKKIVKSSIKPSIKSSFKKQKTKVWVDHLRKFIKVHPSAKKKILKEIEQY